MLRARSVDAPLPAAGYQLPIPVDNPTDAANLAVRMEEDAAVAWRAVDRAGERRARARIRGQRADGLRGQGSPVEPRSGTTPITVAFPGGSRIVS